MSCVDGHNIDDLMLDCFLFTARERPVTSVSSRREAKAQVKEACAAS
jgi:hypothetical protein